MFKTILLPTDFSDISRSAIEYALKLFEKQSCTFYLLNSTSLAVSSMSNFSSRLTTTLINTAKSELNQMAENLMKGRINPNHNFKTLVNQDHLDDSVEWAVNKFGIDLIVMCTKGATGAKSVFFGSNTVHVIKSIKNCPVLIVPEDFKYSEIKEIAFPTDFERFYSEKEILPLKKMAGLFDAQIRILHINEEEELNSVQEYNKSVLTKILESRNIRFHWMPDYAKKAMEIHVFIETLYIDMLAMVRYKHSILEAIFNEPVIKKISFKAKVPFLVMPE
ncbi:MAG: universal stress protein [Flavobacteriaceae bacterium]|nr:universal stress protein [Bacteroidia bacterium]MBT8287135.1 universal stress protein [Bacteroidia bacterium]NNF74849.1 universal stress protein [Flavobacteriaceae bacterium]NNK72711.1 universal stress protein [Flavobacteriaceae bacterium]